MIAVTAEIAAELKRNRKLRDQYKALGDKSGELVASFIDEDINRLEVALVTEDVLEIVRWYEKLKNNRD